MSKLPPHTLSTEGQIGNPNTPQSQPQSQSQSQSHSQPQPPSQPPRAPLPEVGQPFILPQGQAPPQFPDEGPATPISPDIARDRGRYVRYLVTQVEALQKEGKTPAQIEAAVPEFKRDYPKLYEMVMRPGGYHKQSLTTMLAMLDRMGTGQLNQHEASVIVGQRVFDAFVKPDVNNSGSS